MRYFVLGLAECLRTSNARRTRLRLKPAPNAALPTSTMRRRSAGKSHLSLMDVGLPKQTT